MLLRVTPAFAQEICNFYAISGPPLIGVGRVGSFGTTLLLGEAPQVDHGQSRLQLKLSTQAPFSNRAMLELAMAKL
jgi:hypothetical protein